MAALGWVVEELPQQWDDLLVRCLLLAAACGQHRGGCADVAHVSTEVDVLTWHMC
jgi:hypothetical protein